jgi:hypothetical protein
MYDFKFLIVNGFYWYFLLPSQLKEADLIIENHAKLIEYLFSLTFSRETGESNIPST